MSIENEIKDKCARGMLFPLLPLAPGATVRRAMFVAAALWEALDSPEGDLEWEERVGNLRADLENFVTSRDLDWKYLFLLYPEHDCVWEIRSVRDQPSIRVLGLFASKDRFIATNAALREWLGGWQSREWKVVKREALAQWRNLFNPYRPIRTVNVNIVVSGAINGRYFK